MTRCRPRRRGTVLLQIPFLLWSGVFVIIPLLMVAVYSFTGRGGFGFTVFTELFGSAHARRLILKVFGDSFLFALAATVICLLLAFPFALTMTRLSERAGRTLMMLIMVPMWMNFLICTYSWRSILEPDGLLNHILQRLHLPTQQFLGTPGAVIFGMVYNFLPFMMMSIYNVLARMEPSLIEAAQDLGANGRSVLLRVKLPLSLPGIVSGVTMVFVPSVSTFYISQKLGGSKTMLIGDRIELAFLTSYDYGTGAALSLVLMIVILVSMVLLQRFSDPDPQSSFL